MQLPFILLFSHTQQLLLVLCVRGLRERVCGTFITRDIKVYTVQCVVVLHQDALVPPSCLSAPGMIRVVQSLTVREGDEEDHHEEEKAERYST